jgi:hypothetical protein
VSPFGPCGPAEPTSPFGPAGPWGPAGTDDGLVVLLDDPAPLGAFHLALVERRVDLGARNVGDDSVASPGIRHGHGRREQYGNRQHDCAAGVTEKTTHYCIPP